MMLLLCPLLSKAGQKKPQEEVLQTATPLSHVFSSSNAVCHPIYYIKVRNPLWPEMFPSRCYW